MLKNPRNGDFLLIIANRMLNYPENRGCLMCGFRQITQENIAKCDGCECRCAISVDKVDCCKFLPMIAGKTIKKYINKYGETVTLCPINDNFKCMDMGFKIAQLCDCYKQKTR